MSKQKDTQNNITEQCSAPKQKRDIKKTLKSFLSLVLVAVISIVGTWAYLNKKSERIPNTFVGSKGLSLLLKEEKYDNNTKNKKYSPGMSYDKDPVLYNTTVTENGDGDYYEWVAMRVDYIVNENNNTKVVDGKNVTAGLAPGVVSREAIMGDDDTDETKKHGIIKEIDFDIEEDESWVRLDLENDVPYEIYVYKYKLKNDSRETYIDTTNVDNNAIEANGTNDGSRTTPLFTEVTLFDQETLAAHGYSDEYLPKFTISVIGAAIKVEDDIDIDEFNLSSGDASEKTASESIKNALVSLLTTDEINKVIDVNHKETGK